jgi:predicted transcriptional regulator
MTFLELFSLIASAATIFALIVGVFSVWNGRMTRREIGGLIGRDEQATRELIAGEEQATRELIARDEQATRELIAREEQATRELIAREEQATREATRELMAELAELITRGEQATRELLAELITREGQATRELIERLERGLHQVLSRQTEILGRIDERIR